MTTRKKQTIKLNVNGGLSMTLGESHLFCSKMTNVKTVRTNNLKHRNTVNTSMNSSSVKGIHDDNILK